MFALKQMTIFILILSFTEYALAKNNVCKNYIDYLMNMDNNPNCWYNPELYMNSSQILQHRGFKFEEYEVETEDGYFLTIFRLPQPESNKRKGVIILIPPMLSSSDCYIDIGNDSFAYMIWHSGYEVWLANMRGTYYGRKHRKYDPNKDLAFWTFSFHEIGVYDIPAIVEFTSDITGDTKIIVLAFSMSSTASLVYGALKPDHAFKYTKAFVLWAPTSNMVHTRTLTKQSSGLVNMVEDFGLQGYQDLLPHNKFMWDLLSNCRRGPFVILCLSVDLYIFKGKDPKDQPPEWFPIKLGHNPGGVPYRIVSHYLQMAKTGEFTEFDYGMKENLRYYNSSKPPLYPVESIRTPVVLVYGTLDLEAPEIDVLAMYKRFSKEARIYKPIKLVGMHHGGFVYNNIAITLAYKPTIELFDKIYATKYQNDELKRYVNVSDIRN